MRVRRRLHATQAAPPGIGCRPRRGDRERTAVCMVSPGPLRRGPRLELLRRKEQRRERERGPAAAPGQARSIGRVPDARRRGGTVIGSAGRPVRSRGRTGRRHGCGLTCRHAAVWPRSRGTGQSSRAASAEEDPGNRNPSSAHRRSSGRPRHGIVHSDEQRARRWMPESRRLAVRHPRALAALIDPKRHAGFARVAHAAVPARAAFVVHAYSVAADGEAMQRLGGRGVLRHRSARREAVLDPAGPCDPV